MGLKTRLLASGKTEDNEFNISLLGFKMAVNEGLTVFNLVDGIVDEFHDESGTDEAEGSNDTYNATSDFYQNFSPICVSAAFTTTSITEPDTSVAGTNPDWFTGTYGKFTVPTGVTSVNVFTFGAAGGQGNRPCTAQNGGGGGGGFASGTLAVTPGQAVHVVVGEGGLGGDIPNSYTAAAHHIDHRVCDVCCVFSTSHGWARSPADVYCAHLQQFYCRQYRLLDRQCAASYALRPAADPSARRRGREHRLSAVWHGAGLAQ